MFHWHGYYGYVKPSRPREAKGGIKAQSRRGTFGESWWARRWIEVLESFDIGARLGRGRSYARHGQVIAIDVGKGTVKAKVQGSRHRPYTVIIKVKTLSKAEWKSLVDMLGREVIFAAKLLAGEMPGDIEDRFKAAGLSLFPQKRADLHTDCSCPDWSNPCKHIAAVYYLLGEEFDRDPFLIFKLRGMDREELFGLIGGKARTRGRRRRRIGPPQSGKESALPPEPLPSDCLTFWGGGDAPGDFVGEVHVPPIPAPLPQRLGSFPFWRGDENFLDVMERVYRTASPVGMDVLLGEGKERMGER